ncbi:ATP-binding cassette domain-containing protein [Ichthyobacterium seriolicida]|uniref:ABC transporter ATP-binding protein n=1 Tax=Ichthyobacterium seriolicida TaxID=242600 RepID=A0A1J1E599_9FLAO|nr:ABC transporter ATP-binding protein [Ichthyobacterium seriolicida]BAV94478.1 ABC transporter ATP-binding protein [Ichthyobacterium seriolicida]
MITSKASIKNLSVIENKYILIKDISFEIIQGDITIIFGKNGSGKSLLIDCIMNNITYEGEITLSTEKVSVLYDSFVSFSFLRVREILSFFESMYNHARNDDLINRMGIHTIMNKYFKLLSKGERKKIGIYSILISNSDLLIMDEPTDGLDPIFRKFLWNEIKNSGKTVLMTTHIWEEALDIADKVILIDKGSLLNKPENPQELIKSIPYEGKFVFDTKGFTEQEFLLEKKHLICLEEEDRIYVYFREKNEKESILDRLSDRGVVSFSILPIDISDIFLLKTR